MNEPNSVNAERKQRERHARFLRAARQGREKLDGRPALSLRAIAPVTFRTGRSRRREFARRGGRIVFVRVPEASPRGSLLHCPAEMPNGPVGRDRAVSGRALHQRRSSRPSGVPCCLARTPTTAAIPIDPADYASRRNSL